MMFVGRVGRDKRQGKHGYGGKGNCGQLHIRYLHWQKTNETEHPSVPIYPMELRRGEAMTTSRSRQSWKDAPRAKRVAAAISLSLIVSLIAVLTFALLSL
jgi:ribosomal protein L15